MNKVFTNHPMDTSDRAAKMPPIKCAPWCEQGYGHTDAVVPEDQYCTALYEGVELEFAKPEEMNQGPWFRPTVTSYAMKSRNAEPPVELAVDGCGSLSPDEARRLAARLIACADLVSPQA